MTNLNPIEKYLDQLLVSLSSDKLSEIDFDRLSDWLNEVKVSLTNSCLVESELALMREDQINRIAGMVKAVTIVERSTNHTKDVLDYLEGLNNLNSADLIEQYRKTSNRFRIAFPTTFGLLQTSKSKSTELKEIRDFK